MKRHVALWRALAILAIVLGVVFACYQMTLPMLPQYGIVTEVDAKSPGVVRIISVRPHSPAAAAGLKPGDTISSGNTQWDRARILYALPGSRVPVVINGSHTVTLVAPPAQSDPSLWVPFVVRLAFFFVAALLAWRRFDDTPSRSLVAFLWCFGLTIGMRNTVLPSPALTAVFETVGSSIVLLLGSACAAVFAATFPSGNAKPVPRMFSRLAIAIAAAASVLAIASLGLAKTPAQTSWYSFVVLSAMALIALFVVATLVIAYVQGEPQERQRRRWVFVVLALGLTAVSVDIALIAVNRFNFIVDVATLPFIAGIPFGLAYVILRHRVIDVGFVINRALVYTGVSVIVVGVFVIVETLLAKYVENTSHVTSIAVQLAVALALGFSIRYVHARVDRFVDTVLFRDRHLAEAALRTFAQEASYITDRDVLLARCVKTVERFGRARGAGVWVADDSSIYRAETHTFAIAPDVDENDPAVVSMRARRLCVHVRESDSALPGVLAFPMIVRGELLGMLVCGAKFDDETYAPDEEASLVSLASSVGHALDGIEVRELRRRVAELTSTRSGSAI
jgi:GAF domain-containing protein